MAFLPTNASQVQQFAVALYGIKVGTTTMAAVQADITAVGGLNNALNSYYTASFGAQTTAAVAATFVANLGLTGTAATEGAAYVTAALNAAPANARGAVISGVLNLFAGLTANETFGAAATAWNTKVAAAVAYTGAADASVAAGAEFTGTVFTLTTGADSGAAFTGGAGDDSFNATVATLGALDVVDGGAGADTLNIVDAGAVASLGGATFSNIETVKISAGGAVGALSVAAGTTTDAVAQTTTMTVGSASYATSNVITVTIGSAVYTTAPASTANTDVAAAIQAVLQAHLGDDVASSAASLEGLVDVTVSSNVVTILSKKPGTALPAISASVATSGGAAISGGTVTTASSVGNVVKTGPGAIAEALTITVADAEATAGEVTAAEDMAAGETVTVSINGVDYVRGASGTTASTLATDIAATINSAMGATVAVATGAVVTVTAPTAGTALPYIAAKVANASDFSTTYVISVANQVANASAVSASAVAAPVGTTDYNVTATGIASISAPTTTAVTAAGTVVLSSGGAAVSVTASDSVSVTGAKGVVTITDSAKPATAIAINPGVSTANASTAAGVAVTGGTTVTVTGKGGTASSGAITSSATNNTATNIGTDPTKVTSANSDGSIAVTGSTVGATTIAGLANAPTGDVSVTYKTAFTDAKGFADAIYGTGTAKVYTNGGATVSVSGTGTTTITDLQTIATTSNSATAAAVGTSKLATVKLAGVGTTTVNSDAISNATIVDTALGGATTVTLQGSSAATSNAAPLNLTLGNSGKSGATLTVVQANATAVTIATQNSATAAVNGTTNNDNNGTFLTLSTPKATSISMTNTGAVDLGDLSASGTAKVASLNASGATGAVTAIIGSTPLQGLAFTGGAGNDSLTLKSSANFAPNATSAATTTVNLGAGNDKLLNDGTTVHTITGVTFNGGDGVDTVSASLLNAGNAAQFVGFEQLGLDVQSGTFDVSLLAGATGLYMTNNPANTDTVTYSGLTTAQGLTIGESQTTGASVVLDFGTAVKTTSVTDSYTVTFAGVQSVADINGQTAGAISATTIHSGILDVSGIETVNVVSGGTGLVANTVVLKDVVSTTGGARALVMTGDKALTVSFNTAFGVAGISTTANGVASIDASAMTGALTIDTANVATAYAGLSIKGGSGADSITMSAQSSGNGRVTVDAGAGDDTIITSTASSTLIGGAGKDNFNVALAVVASTGTNVITTINDLSAGDKITLASATNNFTTTKVDVSTATSLTAALNAAAADTGGNLVTWFQYAGNTYLVEDLSAGTTLAATDLVVKIVGLVDLSTATYDATANALTLA